MSAIRRRQHPVLRLLLFGVVLFAGVVRGENKTADSSALLSVDILRVSRLGGQKPEQVVEIEFHIKNRDVQAHAIHVAVAEDGLRAFRPIAGSTTLKLPPKTAGMLSVALAGRSSRRLPPLYVENIVVRFDIAEKPGSGVEVAAQVPAPMPEIGRPSVMVTRDQIDAARAKVQNAEWARVSYDALMRLASAWLAKTIEIPSQGGKSPDLYVCRKCGVSLRPMGLQAHECPLCREVFKGEPYDSVTVAQEHTRLALAARALGLAYWFTRDTAYARKCCDILVGYARRYRKYPIQGARGPSGGDIGRVASQSVDEAKWVIPLAHAYDLIAGSGAMGERHKRLVERHLLRPAADLIGRPPQAVSSDMCWRAAAIALIGFALRDCDLAYRAVEGEYGVRRLALQGIGPDGMWREGSWNRHLLAMEALTLAAETASHFGVDLFTSSLGRMFTAPVLAMQPNRTLPPFDNGAVCRLEGDWPYEVAHVQYPGEAMFPWLLSNSARLGIEHVLYGQPLLESVPAPVLGTTLFDTAGLAVLRSSGTEPFYLALDYGPHGGAQGHLDKLSFVLFAHGREMCVDSGSVKPSAPAQENWYRQTVSHNTIVVDQKSQTPGYGLLDFVHSTKTFQLLAVSTDSVYPGVLCDRFVGMIGDRCILIVDRALGTSEHTYDWVLHCRGKLKTAQQFSPTPKRLWASYGYEMLQSLARLNEPGAPLRVDFSEGDRGLSLMLPSTAGMDVITADGMGNPPTERLPMVLARQRGYGAAFLALVEPWRSGPQVETFEAGLVTLPDATETIGYDLWFSITANGWTAHGIVSYNEKLKASPTGMETDGRVGIILNESGKLPAAVLVGGERLTLNGAPVSLEIPVPILNQD